MYWCIIKPSGWNCNDWRCNTHSSFWYANIVFGRVHWHRPTFVWWTSGVDYRIWQSEFNQIINCWDNISRWMNLSLTKLHPTLNTIENGTTYIFQNAMECYACQSLPNQELLVNPWRHCYHPVHTCHISCGNVNS